MITISGKPAVATELLPAEIIGYENMTLFTKHMGICAKRLDGGWPGQELSRLGDGVRKMVAEVLERLWENGYVVLGVDKQGRVQFGCRLRSTSDDLFEGPELEALKRLPLAEIQHRGRSGYLPMVAKMKVARPSMDEMDFERETV